MSAFAAPTIPGRLSARERVACFWSLPASSSFVRWWWTAEVEASPTAWAISRTLGGYPCSAEWERTNARMRSARCWSCFVMLRDCTERMFGLSRGPYPRRRAPRRRCAPRYRARLHDPDTVGARRRGRGTGDRTGGPGDGDALARAPPRPRERDRLARQPRPGARSVARAPGHPRDLHAGRVRVDPHVVQRHRDRHRALAPGHPEELLRRPVGPRRAPVPHRRHDRDRRPHRRGTGDLVPDDAAPHPRRARGHRAEREPHDRRRGEPLALPDAPCGALAVRGRR